MTKHFAFLGLAFAAVLSSACPGQEVGGSGRAVPAATAPAGIKAEAKWLFSGDGGEKWSAAVPSVPGGKVATILARASFKVPDPSAGSFWELTHKLPPRLEMTFALNGREVPVPLKGMYYKAIPAIPAGMLHAGRNELTAKIRIDNRPPRDDRQRVMPAFTFDRPEEPPELARQKLRIQTGPVLGAFGADHFTVTCRTSVPAKVTLHAFDGATETLRLVSREDEAGLFHRLIVKAPNRAEQYVLTAVSAAAQGTYATATITRPVFPTKDLRFVIMGDSRSRTDDWATVAAAVLAERPQFVVFTGDMCGRGTNDWEWDEHFFAPEAARELLATVPFYAVKGNHEENAPVYTELFCTPGGDGRGANWSQQIGPVLLIGIDGQWSPRWKPIYDGVEKTLAASKAKFIFFMSHYPAYSSAGNGKLDERTGQPRHWAYLTGRRVIVPMLVRHKATAFVVSHEHHYERSELPGGLVQIISGGAGAPRSGRSPAAARQNPYAKVFAKTLNYCLVEVAGEKCTLKAKTPDGKVIDTLTWQARKLD